jgi:hypothetical protein
MEKICNKCLIEKNVSCFYKNKNNEDGYNNICKECKKETHQKYYKKNIEKIKEYREIKSEETKEYLKNYYQNNIDKINEYRENNKETLKLKAKQHYLNNREKILEYSKSYNSQNKEKKQEYNKVYRSYNQERINEKDRVRRINDPIYKISGLVRSRLGKYLKSYNITKKNKTFDIVGCSPEFLKKYLEEQFIDGMSWDNHRLFGWHIDHIKPLSSATTEEEVYNLCHYTNLQPLWWFDNLKKGNKYLLFI